MRDYRMWEVKIGRIITEFTIYIAAHKYSEAVNVAIEYARKAKPEWNANVNDIIYLKKLDKVIYVNQRSKS